MEEIKWKQVTIEGFDFYSISEYGDLRNDKTNKIRKKLDDGKGYIRYHIGKIQEEFYVNKFAHRLVAEAFLEATDEQRKLSINHIDGNKKNNHYTNLEYVTNQENTDHAIKTGLFDPVKVQEQNYKSIKVYDKFGIFIKEFASLTEASLELFRINKIGDISEICNKKNGAKLCMGYQFRFSDDKDSPKDISNQTSGIKQRVSQYTKEGKYLNTCNTITEANISINKLPKI